MNYKFYIAIFATVYFANEAEGAKKCAWLKAENAPDNCLKELFQQTLQSFRGKNKFTEQQLDILTVDRVYFNIVNLIYGVEVTAYDVKFFGYCWSTVTDVTKNVNGWTYIIKTRTPFLRADMVYEMTGRLMEAPVFGRGPAKFIFENTTVTHNIKMEKVERDGKKCLKLVDYYVDIDPENFVPIMDNMIDGHASLSLINKIHFVDNGNIMWAAGKQQFLSAYSPLVQEKINMLILNDITFNDIFEDN